jgi:hypothetical protein
VPAWALPNNAAIPDRWDRAIDGERETLTR